MNTIRKELGHSIYRDFMLECVSEYEGGSHSDSVRYQVGRA